MSSSTEKETEEKTAVEEPNPSKETEVPADVGASVEAEASEAASADMPSKKRRRIPGYYTVSDRITHRFDNFIANRRNAELTADTPRIFSVVVSKNPLMKLFNRGLGRVQALPMRFFGLVGGIYGIYLALIYLAKYYALPQFEAKSSHLVLSGVLLLLCFPLLFISDTPSKMINNSRLLSRFFYDLAGLPQNIREKETRSAGLGTAVLVATVMGIISVFVSPFAVLGVIFGLIYLLLSVFSPEFCLTTTVIILPFMPLITESPTKLLCVLICLCAFSYVMKVLLFRRLFHIELLDFLVLAFALVYLISGIVSAARGYPFSASVADILMILGGYFIASNLIKGEDQIIRTVHAITFSSALVAAVGLCERIFGLEVESWVDKELFPTLSVRITSTFGNPNVLGAFLLVSVPVSLCSLFVSGRISTRLMSLVSFLLSFAAAIFTWSRGTWIALVLGLAVFAVAVNRKAIFGVLAVAAAAPAALFFLPDSIVDRFLSAFGSVDSSISYRIEIWRGSAAAAADNLLIGIGPGREPFVSVYPSYAASGAEVAEHSHNLILQILLESGIFALLIFVGLLVAFLFASVECRITDRTRAFRYLYAAGFSATASLVIFSMADNLWYDKRLMLLFWVMLGFCGSLRSWYREQRAVRDSVPTSPYEYSVNIPLIPEKGRRK